LFAMANPWTARRPAVRFALVRNCVRLRAFGATARCGYTVADERRRDSSQHVSELRRRARRCVLPALRPEEGAAQSVAWGGSPGSGPRYGARGRQVPDQRSITVAEARNLVARAVRRTARPLRAADPPLSRAERGVLRRAGVRAAQRPPFQLHDLPGGNARAR